MQPVKRFLVFFLCLMLCASPALRVSVSLGEAVREEAEDEAYFDWLSESSLMQGLWDAYPLRKDLTEGDYEDLYVFELGDDVFAFFEAMQSEEVISYLIVGEERALMFDTGLGIFDLRGMAEKITDLPLTALVSHAHYDHIGGMAAFDNVLCYNDPEMIKLLERGLPHEDYADYAVLDEYFGDLPAGLDPETISTPGRTPTDVVEDGDCIDLGGRVLEVMYTPGHSGIDIMLLDAAHHILFTADMYYPGPVVINLGTDAALKTYSDIMKKVLARVDALGITRIYGGHNSIEETPDGLRMFTAFAEDVANGLVPYSETEEYGYKIQAYEYEPDPTRSIWLMVK